MSDFNLRELGVLHIMVSSSLEEGDDLNAPPQIIEILQQILAKLEPLIDEQCKIFNEFQSIAEDLGDLELSAKILINDPEAEIPEYH
jgi:hypothetical protein